MEELYIFEVFNGIYSSYRPETLQYVALVAFKHVATLPGKEKNLPFFRPWLSQHSFFRELAAHTEESQL